MIYKVSVEQWPLQQLPPVALDGIITPFWCIPLIFYYIHIYQAKTLQWVPLLMMPTNNNQQCVLNTILTNVHTVPMIHCIVLLPFMVEDGITMGDGNKALFIN